MFTPEDEIGDADSCLFTNFLAIEVEAFNGDKPHRAVSEESAPPGGTKRAHDDNIFEMNDAEQLHFIANQLENVAEEHDNVAAFDVGALGQQQHPQAVYDYPIDDLAGASDPSLQLKMQSMPILDNLVRVAAFQCAVYLFSQLQSLVESDSGHVRPRILSGHVQHRNSARKRPRSNLPDSELFV